MSGCLFRCNVIASSIWNLASCSQVLTCLTKADSLRLLR